MQINAHTPSDEAPPQDDVSVEQLLSAFEGLPDGASAPPADAPSAAWVAPRPHPLGGLMRQIPVTLTLEVGSATVSLEDLSGLGRDSVIELDTLAGEPLVVKVNGIAIGRAEVVVSGESYGLKVVDITELGLDQLAP